MELDNIFEGIKENKKTLIITLALLVVLIIVSIVNFIFDNKKESIDVESVVRSFAELYYEESYYPQVKSVYEDNYIDVFEEYQKDGIKLTLRQIVNIFDDVETSVFYEEGNYCNFIETYALIYPKYPYDIEDYEIKVKVSCTKDLSLLK